MHVEDMVRTKCGHFIIVGDLDYIDRNYIFHAQYHFVIESLH